MSNKESGGSLGTAATEPPRSEIFDDAGEPFDRESEDCSSTSSSGDLNSTVQSIKTTELNPNGSIIAELEFNENKLKRYRQYYSDAYVSLFNNTQDWTDVSSTALTSRDEPLATDFEDSQFGCVAWTATEKASLFQALSKYGRHDLPRLSEAVVTKSQIELKAYIDRLREAFVDRQRFSRETKNVSHAEFPTAVEVGPELEGKLDRCAMALSVVQDGYDLAAGKQKWGGEWVVTKVLAHALDNKTDKSYSMEDEGREALNNERSRPDIAPPDLFNLAKWLDITETVFMNWPTESAFEHWSTIAEPGQHPSLTMDALTDFHYLAVSLTQRVLQVAIFMAKSRIRASMSTVRRPAKILSKADVHTALDVLNMKHDAWEYWARLPRRNELKVYTNTHRKGQKSTVVLDALAAEKILLQMSSTRQSRSRSTSRGRSTSVELSLTDDQDVSEEDQVSVDSDLNDDVVEDDNDDNSKELSTEEQSADGQETSTDESEGMIEEPPTQHISHKKRKLTLEEDQDDYMERLDRQTQLQHERYMWHLLGESVATAIKDEDEELGIRPKTMRKTKDEIQDWTTQYDLMLEDDPARND